MRTWALRYVGLSAVVVGVGFGGFDVPAIWHLARDDRVWYSGGNPTYGYGPLYDHGIDTTVPLLIAFLAACVVLTVGGILLLVPRPAGIPVTVAGMATCTPFWWGFDLPFALGMVGSALILLLVVVHDVRTRQLQRG